MSGSQASALKPPLKPKIPAQAAAQAPRSSPPLKPRSSFLPELFKYNIVYIYTQTYFVQYQQA